MINDKETKTTESEVATLLNSYSEVPQTDFEFELFLNSNSTNHEVILKTIYDNNNENTESTSEFSPES